MQRLPGAKIRMYPDGGYAIASTGWGDTGKGDESNVVFLVKFNSKLKMEWSKSYGDPRGARFEGWHIFPKDKVTSNKKELNKWHYFMAQFLLAHLKGISEGSPLRTCLFTNFRGETVSYGVI